MKLREAKKMVEQTHPNEIRRSLRFLRESVGLNQLELAKLSGVPQSNIHRIEVGLQDVTPRTLVRLANAIQRKSEKRLSQAKKMRESALFRALGAPPPTEQEMEVFRSKKELVREERRLAALDWAIANPEGDNDFLGVMSASGRIYRPKNSPTYWIEFSARGQVFQEAANTESKDEANDFLSKRMHEKLHELREQETERKQRQLVALENLQSIDDPIVKELMESLRREIADLQHKGVEKDKRIEEMARALEEK